MNAAIDVSAGASQKHGGDGESLANGSKHLHQICINLVATSERRHPRRGVVGAELLASYDSTTEVRETAAPTYVTMLPLLLVLGV